MLFIFSFLNSPSGSTQVEWWSPRLLICVSAGAEVGGSRTYDELRFGLMDVLALCFVCGTL